MCAIFNLAFSISKRSLSTSRLPSKLNKSTTGIIVLAAGASVRMGEPKQLLRFQGETLLRRAVNVALETTCRPVIVVLGVAAEKIGEETSGLEVQIVVNELWAEGMSSAIRCGINALESATAGEAQAAILTLCDQPFVTSNVINRLIKKHGECDAAIIASEYGMGENKTRGVPALFRRSVFPALMQLRGAEGAKRIIMRYAQQSAAIATPEAAMDIDTPDDYRNLTHAE